MVHLTPCQVAAHVLTVEDLVNSTISAMKTKYLDQYSMQRAPLDMESNKETSIKGSLASFITRSIGPHFGLTPSTLPGLSRRFAR